MTLVHTRALFSTEQNQKYIYASGKLVLMVVIVFEPKGLQEFKDGNILIITYLKEDHRSTAMIFPQIILHSAVYIYDFHIFIISSSSFHGFITNQFNDRDLPPVGLLAQLVERCTGIAEVKGSNPVQA